MLQTLRDKTSGWFATVILGLLIVPFALWGLQDYLGQRSTTHVAQIDLPPTWWESAPRWWPVSMVWDHEKIGVDEFRTRFEQVRQQARADQGERFDARAFESADNKRQVLDGLVGQKLQEIVAKREGLVVSDAMVRKAIQDVAAFQVNGKFDPQRYQLALASQVPTQTPRQFEDSVRTSLVQAMLGGNIGDSSFVTDGEMTRLLRLSGERRGLSMLLVPPPAPDATPVPDAQLRSWFAAHQAQFRTPETVSLEYVELDAAAMPAPAPPDEAALRARFEKEKERYSAQEQRLTSHILVRVPDGASAAVQKAAEEKAAKLAAQAKAPGADFAALARANTDDTGTKASGGDLGWVTRGMMVGGFEDALFKMQAGQIMGPVKSDFGWHVIQLREIKAGAQGGFEAAREALVREQIDADREKAFNDLSNKLVDLVYKNPSALTPSARAVNLPVLTTGPITRAETTGIAANAAVRRAAFSEALVQDGTVSDPIELGPDHSVLIRVIAHKPEQIPPFEQVRPAVLAAVQADRAKSKARVEAAALVARLKAGETLAAVATARGLPAPSEVPALPRGAPLPGKGLSEAVFAAPAPAAGKSSPGMLVMDDGAIALFTVNSVTPGSVEEMPPAQRNQLQQQLAGLRGVAEVQEWVKALRKRYHVEIVESNL